MIAEKYELSFEITTTRDGMNRVEIKMGDQGLFYQTNTYKDSKSALSEAKGFLKMMEMEINSNLDLIEKIFGV